METSQRYLPCGLATALVLVLGATAAQANEVYLRAGSFTKNLPNGTGTTPVTMWGYEQCDDPAYSVNCTGLSSPGPEITVPVGDTTLVVHLKNDLTEPTSLVMPGQRSNVAPVKTADADGRLRVSAFTAEVAPAATGDYVWTGLPSGTYLYQSGSHVQKQVQMGLYGALVHDAPCSSPFTCAYPSIPYESQKTLVFSEIDPALHDPTPTAANLTKGGYAPRFFLVNGEPYTSASSPVATPTPGSWTLLRLLNAGLENHAPQLLGGYFEIVAEDGKPSPAGVKRTQHTTLLPAAKSLDVMFTPTGTGTFWILDRRLRLTNDSATGGGMLAKIEASGTATTRPTAVADSYSTAEDSALPIAMPGVLGNDLLNGLPDPLQAVFGTQPGKGSLTLNTDGSFSYQPDANASGLDTFTYRASSGTTLSDEALVTIDVTPVNDAPLASDDFYYVTMNSSSAATSGALPIAAPGVLANDTDVDAGNALTAVNYGLLQSAGGWTRPSANADGSFTINIPSGNAYVGRAWFTYAASDGTLQAPATVSVVRDLRVVFAQGGSVATRSPIFRDPSGTANDRWQIRGTIRALPSAVVLTLSLGAQPGGTIIGTVTVPAGDTAWTFDQSLNLPLVRPVTPTGSISVTASIPDDGVVPAHTAAIVDVPYSRVTQ